MRSKTIFGALLVSVALCSQGFGFELLDRMLGLNCGGCGECKACAKVACCEPCAKACCPEPACCAKPRLLREGLLRAGLLREGHLRQVLQVPAYPGARPVRGHEGIVRVQGRDLRDLGCCTRQGLLPGTACCAKPHCCEKACCEPNCCEKVKHCCKVRCCEKACCARRAARSRAAAKGLLQARLLRADLRAEVPQAVSPPGGRTA